MLTRLKVSGFKNLVDVDVRFGPFTCIAGPNGVGKSNLFDAIRFLSALADRPLVEAALTVRGDENGGRTADVRSLFQRYGDEYASEMSFEVEMIVPSEGKDDLGESANATTTLLRYALVLAYRKDESLSSSGPLEILKEHLTYLKKTHAPKHLLFEHKLAWRSSAVRGKRGSDYVSTEDQEGERVIKLHQDGRHGRPLKRLAKNLPRTVLSATNAAESPTALLARREMRSWRLLQLEPSALRRPDEFSAPTKLTSDGSHLAATLYRLASRNGSGQTDSSSGNSRVCAEIANRLAELIDDVYKVSIDRDEKRELLTLNVTGRDKTAHAARALSDGTLRFLALGVLERDPETQGVLCLEEPENGIHPARIPAMIRLLRDIATDVSEPVDFENPLRQVIVNTHSPVVVQQVPEDTLLVAEPKESICSGKRFNGVRFSCLPETWREERSTDRIDICKKGDLLAYLNPVLPANADIEEDDSPRTSSATKTRLRRSRRVIDRPDIAPYFPGISPIE